MVKKSRFYGSIILSLICLLLGSHQTWAQSVITVKLGAFNPQDAKAGFIAGITTGRQVDEMVDFGLGVDLFIRQFTQKTVISSGGSGADTTQTNIDYSMFGLPIMVHLDFRLMPQSPIRPYLGIAGGYEILFSREANYEAGVKDSRLYSGFGWQLMVGGEYALGSSSGLLAEILYNGCTVKRGLGETAQGIPLHEELDFSGLGFRLGVRIGGR